MECRDYRLVFVGDHVREHLFCRRTYPAVVFIVVFTVILLYLLIREVALILRGVVGEVRAAELRTGLLAGKRALTLGVGVGGDCLCFQRLCAEICGHLRADCPYHVLAHGHYEDFAGGDVEYLVRLGGNCCISRYFGFGERDGLGRNCGSSVQTGRHSGDRSYHKAEE